MPIRRPIAWICLAFATGVLLSGLAGPFGRMGDGAALFIAGGTLGAACLLTRRRWRFGMVLFTFVALGGLSENLQRPNVSGDALGRHCVDHPHAFYALEGSVQYADLILPGMTYARLWLDVDRVMFDGQEMALPGGVLVGWEKPGKSLLPGDRVRIAGNLSPKLSTVNPGIADYEDYLRKRGVHSRMTVFGQDAVEVLNKGVPLHPRYWIAWLRLEEARRFEQVMPESVLPFVLAVWMGEMGQMNNDPLYQSFVDSGTAHILSVSGIHVSVIYMTLSYVLRRSSLRRRTRIAVLIGAMLIFSILAGARASCLRSAFMVVVYLMSEWFEREPDTRTALGLSGFILLLWEPECLFDPGFLLSFTSVASILAFHGPIYRYFYTFCFPERNPFLRPYPVWQKQLAVPLFGSLAMSLSVLVLPFPLMIRYFSVFPLIGPLANLIVVPVSTIVLWLCLLTAASSLLSGIISTMFGHALAPFVWFIQECVQLAGQAPLGHFRLVSPPPLAMMAYWGMVGCAVGAIAAKASNLAGSMRMVRRWRWGAVGLAVLMLIAWRPWFERPGVVFLDVNHGAAAVIRTPGGDTVLVDGGDNRRGYDLGARVVAPYLRNHQIRRVDCVVLTHADSDHVGGLYYVVDTLKVGCVVMGPDRSDPAAERFMQYCAERRVPVRHVQGGDKIDLAGATLTVLHPPADRAWDSDRNDASLVTRLQWPGLDVLFPGDIEAEGEAVLAPLLDGVQTVCVPHHASATSSADAFVRAARPVACVISSGGASGREGLDGAVLARWRAAGATLMRTDQLGGITLTVRDGQPVFQSARLMRRYPVAADAMLLPRGR